MDLGVRHILIQIQIRLIIICAKPHAFSPIFFLKKSQTGNCYEYAYFSNLCAILGICRLSSSLQPTHHTVFCQNQITPTNIKHMYPVLVVSFTFL